MVVVKKAPVEWCSWQLLFFVVSTSLGFAWNAVVTDCDETFGYWEPLHNLVYGHGLQTWEYSPQFALRPYIFLVPFSLLARLLRWMSKRAVYRSIRLILSLMTVTCQYQWCSAVATAWGKSVAGLSFLLLAVTPGMVQASSALLPNSLSMNLMTLLWTQYLQGADNRAVFLAMVIAVFGWPYALLAAIVPLVTTMRTEITAKNGATMRTSDLSMAKWIEVLSRRWFIATVFGICYLVLPSILIDRIYYGRWTMANMNALIYNLFSRGGSHLFGVESRWFLLKNLLLNFNFVAPLSLLAVLVRQKDGVRAMWLTLVGCVSIFSIPAHKEERFLYPIYPILVVLASVALCSFVGNRTRRILIIAILLLCGCRNVAVIRNHRAPEQIFSKIPSHSKGLLCMADAWHLFPSHFHLSNSLRVGFVENRFKGILPRYFDKNANFNDMNEGTSEQFVDPARCDYLVLTETEAVEIGLAFSSPIVCAEMVTSGGPARWLYVPFLQPTRQTMCLLKYPK
ncbi:hypothetical protein PSACC_01105 [Paramicrosporidium saccamoebae]|uniref:Mannosyltransferase n=1 Tax=Paramicrosporidium saccamoebae TaxID=1246581 RepID=A0A2H9TMV2_9FUNG|nr:hypothetical protein PSACC_01105 [Paramicrosporidium saccamoebae]